MSTTITTKKSVSISRNEIDKKGAIVILSMKEYQKLCEKAVPTYYLKGKEAENLDKLVEEGLREHRKCRCKTIKSLANLDVGTHEVYK